ncbi:MAG: SDR family oxidoreductase [Dehalococcoidia bacterium]|jgi:NAD(P)-dependent dehydrogenase (short-subunit alcohol dehydrogenase family)|nr:SDR family oxidoreductase [Dehalococcoidia bacterium]
MTGSFEGKVALVTGATSGIGRATAIAFGRQGASVVVAGRREAEGFETVAQIEALGAAAKFVQTDVSRSADVENMVRTAVLTYGKLDCAINNASVGWPSGLKRLHEYSEAEWYEVSDINEKGVWLCMRSELKQMLHQEPDGDAGLRGVITNVGSVASLRAGPTAPYTASKHAVLGLTRSAALEYGRDAIRVNALCPGVVQTDMVNPGVTVPTEMAEMFVAANRLGRWGKPDEIADAILYSCSDESTFMTGHALVIDGGLSA